MALSAAASGDGSGRGREGIIWTVEVPKRQSEDENDLGIESALSRGMENKPWH